MSAELEAARAHRVLKDAIAACLPDASLGMTVYAAASSFAKAMAVLAKHQAREELRDEQE